MNIGLIITSGVSARMNNAIPKQFMTVYNKPIIIYTLEAFEKHLSVQISKIRTNNG